MLLYFVIFTVALAIPGRKIRAVNTVDWCHYWSSLGIEKDECRLLGRDLTTTTVATITEAMPICTRKFFFSTCRSDSRCSSGLICKDTANFSCCHPTKDICPTFEQMEIKCVVRNPVNWCAYDGECGPSGKCCPTGCDYNICV